MSYKSRPKGHRSAIQLIFSLAWVALFALLAFETVWHVLLFDSLVLIFFMKTDDDMIDIQNTTKAYIEDLGNFLR